MAEDDEQTRLSDEPPVEAEPGDGETYHAKIVRLCHSEGLPKIAAGYSLKILVEGLIIGGTLGIVLLAPLLGLVHLGVSYVTYMRAFIAWGSATVTILASAFCLLENVTDSRELFATPEQGDD
jgi:hypothetical protein